MAGNARRSRRLMEPEPQNCTLQDAEGRHERCPGDSCPFRAGQGDTRLTGFARTSRRIPNSQATCSIYGPRLPAWRAGACFGCCPEAVRRANEPYGQHFDLIAVSVIMSPLPLLGCGRSASACGAIDQTARLGR
jgi:hypothetical protein